MDGIIDNLENALATWNEKLTEIWYLLTESPTTFKGGGIWSIVSNINSALSAIGIALVVLFFVAGFVKQTTDLHSFRRPEEVFRYFIRFSIARVLVVYGMEFMTAIFEIVQGIIVSISNTVGIGTTTALNVPNEIITAVEDVGFFSSIPLWIITFVGGLIITVLSFIMILTVYGRFFKLYMYTAISPIPLSASASQSTQSIAFTFLKSYMGVCMEGAIIILACIIYSAFVTSAPLVDASASASTMLWKYIQEIIFNLLILVGTIKMSDHLVKDMMGL